MRPVVCMSEAPERPNKQGEHGQWGCCHALGLPRSSPWEGTPAELLLWEVQEDIFRGAAKGGAGKAAANTVSLSPCGGWTLDAQRARRGWH